MFFVTFADHVKGFSSVQDMINIAERFFPPEGFDEMGTNRCAIVIVDRGLGGGVRDSDAGILDWEWEEFLAMIRWEKWWFSKE